MLSYAVLVLTTLALLMQPLSSFAATFAVGTCRPKLQTYSTISQAVGSVPSGSTILVCSGTYPEQVRITQPLTLRGAVSGDSDRPIITVPTAVPGAGFRLQVSVTSQATRVYLGGFFPFAAQVLVQSPNVFIEDVTVDGTGGDMSCSTTNIWLAGIFYDSGSSGTVNRVTTRNQLDEGCGSGIWAEDTTGPNQSLTIQNSSIHDFDFAGIFASTAGQDRWFTTTIRNNFVTRAAGVSQTGGHGIETDFLSGFVGNNVVTGGDVGIFNLSSAPLTLILRNKVADTRIGISTGYDGGTIQYNDISNASTGIDLESNAASATNNIIMNSNIGIEFNCNNDSVSGNDINDSAIGVDHDPFFGFGPPDRFFNVDTIVTGCN